MQNLTNHRRPDLRRRILLYTAARFAALLQLGNLLIIRFVRFVGIAMVTPQWVFRSIRRLTAAARCMTAVGHSGPGSMNVQDEVAQLTDSVEATRRQLQIALEERTAANRELEDRVKERTGQLRNALRQVITAQEGERQRVARDLHDDVVQQLILLSRGLDSFANSNGHSGTLESRRIEELRSSARNALHSLREVSRDLRPSVLDDLGLSHALRWIGHRIGERSGLHVDVRTNIEESQIGGDESLTLFRIAQEALHNVERHADAVTVNVILKDEEDMIVMIVQDDGQGFAPSQDFNGLANSGHFGLVGMTERAMLLGGNVKLESEAGKGTTVTAWLPRKSALLAVVNPVRTTEPIPSA